MINDIMHKQTPANAGSTTNKQSLAPNLAEVLGDRIGNLPVWVRAPKRGVEHYTGLSRSKLYELASEGAIGTKSLRKPGQLKGVRLFNLASVLAYIDSQSEEHGGMAA